MIYPNAMTNKHEIAKVVLLSIVIFTFLLSITPMIILGTFCGGSGAEFGCTLKTSVQFYFPVYRTVVCKIWNEPGCAPGTFLYGWYQDLINPINILIVGIVLIISIIVSKRVMSRNSNNL